MNKSGFTLIETMLSTILVVLFMSFCVFDFGSLTNSKIKLDNKIENYIILNRYVKCNAEISGIKAKILIETNKLKVVTEDYKGNVNSIPTLQYQLDDLNDSVLFDSEDTNVVTYFPDGTIEKEGTVEIKTEEEEQMWVTIGDFNRVTVSSNYTNNVCEEDF